jgi:hypothetical protein
MELLFLRNQSDARWKKIPWQIKFDTMLLCEKFQHSLGADLVA